MLNKRHLTDSSASLRFLQVFSPRKGIEDLRVPGEIKLAVNELYNFNIFMVDYRYI